MSKSRQVAIGGIAGAVLAAGIVAAVLHVQAQHRQFVDETLDLLTQAQQAYDRGEFNDAAQLVSTAGSKHQQHADWFDPIHHEELKRAEQFFGAQASIWNEAEAAAGTVTVDVRKAREDLESILNKAQAGGERTESLARRVGTLLETARTKEFGMVKWLVEKRIEEACAHYEKGSWAEFHESRESIQKALETLSEHARMDLVRSVDLLKINEPAERLAQFDAILKGPDEMFARADQLRELLEKIPETDKALRRDVGTRIEELDKETRPPLKGIKLPPEGKKQITDMFLKSGARVEAVAGGDDSSIELKNAQHRFTIRLIDENDPKVLIEVDRVRLAFGLDMVEDREGFALQTAAMLAKGLRATKDPQVMSPDPWDVVGDAPGPCAVTSSGDKAWLYLQGRIFQGKIHDEDPDSRPRILTFLRRAQALEGAVRSDKGVPEEYRGPLTALLKATYTPTQPHDHLEGEFCREAVYGGYLEAQLKQVDPALAQKIKEYRESYDEVAKFRPRVEAKTSAGAGLDWKLNLEGESVWRLVDGNTTSFTMAPRDPMKTRLVVNTVFEGVHETWPENASPIRVQMFHPAVGEIARWDGAFTFNAELWAKALRTEDRPGRPEYFQTTDWMIPPHAVIVDSRGQAKALVLPAGVLKVGPLKTAEEKEKFLDECAKVLRSPGELHLFFRYFVQYVLDSPVTTAVTLIGSSKHTGDVHQDAHETLDRWMIGRFLADCDDLAELYQNILRRQGKLAHVLGVPGHATCGTAEKDGDQWVFYCVDTGPPRMLRGPDLDSIIEKVARSYDDDGSMPFDPRSIQFLFRFNNEQTRASYWLDSRIFRDAAYAETMIRVQEYWHFSFYALGIESMKKLLETDRMPANCLELSGLYTRVRMWEESIRWSEAAIAGFDPKDPISRLNESMRVVTSLKELKRDGEALQRLRASSAEIDKACRDHPEEAGRYRRMKFEIASTLAALGEPWEGWSLVRPDVGGFMADALAAMLSLIYGKMRDKEREGAALTEANKASMAELGTMLERFYARSLFKKDDSYPDLVRKYSQLLAFYVARDGPDAAYPELLKKEFPKGPRQHDARKPDERELDWKWIRMSPYAYSAASGVGLDREKKRPDGPKEAAAYIRAMEEALPEIRKQGSLGTMEFAVLDLKLIRACIEMDEAALKEVFGEMKRQGWADLYETISETFGRMAPYMSVENFEKVFRLYCSYEVPRRHYYGVVYSAFQLEATAHAVAASKVCREKFPADPDMKREHDLLLKLAGQK